MAVVSSSTREEEKAEGGEKIQKLKYLHCLKVFIYFLFLPFSIISTPTHHVTSINTVPPNLFFLVFQSPVPVLLLLGLLLLVLLMLSQFLLCKLKAPVQQRLPNDRRDSCIVRLLAL